jgi:type I restriction enzyme M protein
MRELRDSIKGVSDKTQRQSVEDEIESLKAESEGLRLKARDAQATGDRLYWPIFNLDVKNPNAPEKESYDPDELLVQYKQLLGEIKETENQLKSELAAALAHHFITETEEA